MVSKTAVPVVRTKLYRPRVAQDLVAREDLLARLEEGYKLPLTLVSAPAGYGKSTLISHWLETHDGPGAWLSLDEYDDDLRSFLTYVVAAVRTVFPQACPTTLSMANADELPPVQAVMRCLSNDLDTVDVRFVLALDDYHRIRDPAIHELIDQLIRYPLRCLHLVILGRRDPPLSLARLRAHRQLTEVRMQDLRFGERATGTFLERAAGLSVRGDTLSRLHEKTEGWPVGLRLTALALRHQGDVEEFVRGLSGGSRHIQEYLLQEVLSQEPPAVRDCLCKTSILDRFCTSLSKAVCGSGSDCFAQLLDEAGLLCIALDQRGEWRRYHHLFQGLLQRQLTAESSAEEITALHRRASGWFAENRLIEEAVRHALKGGDTAAAARLVAQNGNEAMNKEEWVQLGRWLDMLEPDVIESNPELLVLRTWLNEYRYKYEEAWKDIARAEPMVSALPSESDARRRLTGELLTQRSQQHYFESDADSAVSCAKRAMALLDPGAQSVSGYAILILAVSYQMAGGINRAHQVLNDALADHSRSGPVFRARVFMSLCWTHWMSGDLDGLEQAAKWLLRHGKEHHQPETIDFGRYFLGSFHYHRNELAEAERQLGPLVEQPYATRTEIYSHGAFALAFCHAAQGRAGEAQDLADSVLAHMLETTNTFAAPIARAFRAEIALRRGQPAEAEQWARRFPFEPLPPMPMFYEPRMTLARLMIVENTFDSLARAGSVLTRLSAYVLQTHNTRFLIEVRALQSLRYTALGNEEAALKELRAAVKLAQPGGFVRIFADLGPELAKLLNRLDLDEAGLHYVGRILAAFRGSGTEAEPAERQRGVDPLSKRELEILTLLSDRLANQEIADRLHISVVTVKRHAANIYEKLGVHGRRQAVAKAAGLGIIP